MIATKFLFPGGATNSQNSPHISIWPLDQVRLALKYEAFTQGRRKRIASAKSGARMQFEEDLPSLNLLSQNEIEEIRNDIRELKTSSNGPSQKPAQNNRGACFGCGQMDHMIRSCPYRDTSGSVPRYGNDYYRSNRSGYQNNQSTDGNVRNDGYVSNNGNVNNNGRNWRRNKNQGNGKKLAPRVRPQL